MKSGKHNIEIEAGSQYDITLTITNADGSDYSLTGYTPTMQIGNVDGKLILDCDSYISVANGNELVIAIPASATNNIKETMGFYQIEIVSGVTEHSVLRGNATFVMSAVR